MRATQRLYRPRQEAMVRPFLRVALGAGAVLFVCGTAAALWRATGRTQWLRWILGPAAALGVIALGAIPWIALAIIFAMLAVIALVEEMAARK